LGNDANQRVGGCSTAADADIDVANRTFHDFAMFRNLAVALMASADQLRTNNGLFADMLSHYLEESN